jgi:plastocyanin
VGLEHEYVLSRDGEPADFRELIHGLAIPGRRLDPGDANAYRLPSGLVLTCDAQDAEVVSPPVAVEPGFAADVAAWADEGWHQLSGVLPPGLEANGFSTHLSASMPEAVARRVAALFATTFAPAVMLVLDHADSHGVFVRPRPGRIEVCGEHATGPRLGVAAALVAGGARACAAAVAGAVGPDRLPPVLDVDVRLATGRYGLFVGRHLAFGFDLYAAGRQARLPTEGGGTIEAQAYLELAWRATRLALGTDATDGDLDAGDRMVAGSIPLGIEGAVDRGAPAPGGHLPPSPYGDLLASRHRPRFSVAPAAATWDFTVFGLRGAARRAYASVPGTQLGAFLGQLDAGRLDGLLTGFVDASPTGSVLVAHDQTLDAGLWDDAVLGPDLLAYERSATDGDEALAIVPPEALSVAGLLADELPSVSYVRRGKGGLAATGTRRPVYRPISARDRGVGVAESFPAELDGRPATVSPPPPVAPARPPSPVVAPSPVVPERRHRRRRRAWVAAAALTVLMLAGSAAALTGVFAAHEPPAVSVLTGPSVPPGSSVTGPGPSTTNVPDNAGVGEPLQAPGVFTSVATSVDPTSPTTVGTATATPAPAATNAGPATTVTAAAPTTTAPAATTTTATTSAPTTTVAVGGATQITVAVSQGILGCGFQPSSVGAVAGSTVRFRNDTASPLTIVVAPLPGAATTTISLLPGATSGANVLSTPGSYPVACSSGGDSVVGRMTITVTGGP